MPVLTLVDLSGIQNFRFPSPTWSQIAAASDSVAELTSANGYYRSCISEAGRTIVFADGCNCAFVEPDHYRAAEVVRTL